MSRRSNHNRGSFRPGGSLPAALAILTLVILAVAGYLLFKSGSHPEPSPETRSVEKTPETPYQPEVHHTARNYSAAKKTPPPPHTYPGPANVPEETASRDLPASRSGRLAIIVDDMGSSMQEAHALADIGVPLTFSVIPGLRSYREVAAFAASSGIETMIHIPMQSQGWPERRLESNGLLVSMTEMAISERLEEFMRTLPKAVGANNHMGSEFTEHEDKMRVVLTALKGRGLYFVDSVTSPDTVGMKLARELNMKSGKRSVFLDNEQDSAYIRGQLNQAVRLAKRTGGVIAICHPHPVTMKTLADVLPALSNQGITLVPASQLVR